MTTFRQPNAAAVSSEVKDAGVAATMGAAHLVDSAGEVVPELVSVGSATRAELVDWHNAGVEYEALLTDTPWVLIDLGGGVIGPSASGTPAAILIDDGVGKLVATTDLTKTPAGALYKSVNDSVVAARFDAPRELLAQVGTTIIAYQGAG